MNATPEQKNQSNIVETQPAKAPETVKNFGESDAEAVARQDAAVRAEGQEYCSTHIDAANKRIAKITQTVPMNVTNVSIG